MLLVVEDVVQEAAEVAEVAEVEEGAGDSDIQHFSLSIYKFFYLQNDQYSANFIRMYLCEAVFLM